MGRAVPSAATDRAGDADCGEVSGTVAPEVAVDDGASVAADPVVAAPGVGAVATAADMAGTDVVEAPPVHPAKSAVNAAAATAAIDLRRPPIDEPSRVACSARPPRCRPP
jgi:hypothetical protein